MHWLYEKWFVFARVNAASLVFMKHHKSEEISVPSSKEKQITKTVDFFYIKWRIASWSIAL